MPGEGLARALGWFSLGLGLAEALAPETMSRLTGMRRPSLVRAYGLREILCGVGILMSDQPAGWVWARVAGDALDLATLGESAVEVDGDGRGRSLASAAAVAGVTVLDMLAGLQLSAASSLEG